MSLTAFSFGWERLINAFCVGGENLPTIFSLQGKDLDRRIFVRSGGFPNWFFFRMRKYSSRREDPPIVFSLTRGELPIIFSLAVKNLAIAFSLGRENHSIVFSVGGNVLATAFSWRWQTLSFSVFLGRRWESPCCLSKDRDIISQLSLREQDW